MARKNEVLYEAAQRGDDKAIAQLLVENPLIANEVSVSGGTALHCAASYGHDKVVELLLAASPGLIDAVDSLGLTALHHAVIGRHCPAVAALLAVQSSSVDAVDLGGQTALHWAVASGLEPMVELLLARSALTVDSSANTVLHVATGCQHGRLLSRLLALSPEAVRAVNKHGETPFHLAVAADYTFAIDLLQWSLTFDEIVSAFTACEKSHIERLRPIVEEQCAGLKDVLHRDVVGTVFEYLGFNHTTKRTRVDTVPSEASYKDFYLH